MNSRPPSDNQPPPPPPSPREELEARLTALALGEAGAFEAETLRARIAAEPDLAALYQRIQAAILAYKNTFEDERASAHLPPPEPAPEHLSPDRAARLARLFASAHAETASAPAKNLPPPRATRKIIPFPFLVQVLGAAACLVLLAFLTMTSLSSKLGVSGIEQRVASAEAKNDRTEQKKIADISLPLKENEAPKLVPDNIAVATGNQAGTGSAAPAILSAAQLANSVAADNANAQDANSANSLLSDRAKTNVQQSINFSVGDSATPLTLDYAATSPEGPAPTNPPFGNSPTDKQGADQQTEVTAKFGLNSASLPPPPPPPTLAASTPGVNVGSGAFGAGGSGQGGAILGGRGGRGGRSGAGGRGGAIAAINPPAAASAAAPSPEPGAASLSSGVRINAGPPAEADQALFKQLAEDSSSTITINNASTFTGVVTGKGNLTIVAGAGNLGYSNTFGGDATSLPSSGPADAGGLVAADSTNARAANSLTAGTGSWVVESNGTYTGGTTINAGTLSFKASTATNATLGGLSGNRTLSFGTLSASQNYAASDISAGPQPASGLSFNGGNLQHVGPANNADANGLSSNHADALGNNESFATTLSGNGTTVRAGNGVLTLVGNHTVSGVITLTGGTLSTTNQNTSDYKVVQTGGALGLQDNGGTGQAPFTIGGQTFGRGSVMKTGTGTLSLDQQNTFNGTTTITAGKLVIGSNTRDIAGQVSNNASAANNVALNLGAPIDLQQLRSVGQAGDGNLALNSGTFQFGSTSFIVQGGALNISDSRNEPQSTAFDAATTNAQEPSLGTVKANLTKAGAGELTLAGINTYAEGTLVTGGSINFSPQNNFGTSTANTAPAANNLRGMRADDWAVNQGSQQQNPANYQLQGGNLQSNGRAVAPAQQIANIITAPAAPAATPLPALQKDQPVARPPSEVKFPAPVATADNAFSTFALNVNDASYQLARTALQNHRWPDPAATRTEEFLNAFRYHDPLPATGEACTLHYDLARNPVESGDLLRVSFQTAAAGRDRLTPLRLTILLDDSGSMTRADRVATVQAALRALGNLLRADDQVSLVTFARTPQVRATALTANHYDEILALAGSIEPEGGTNMEEALRTAYATARQTYDEHAQNRVILLTDGAANLGELDPTALAGIVEENRKAGIALDAYGVGWDGYDDTTLEALTRKSDGRYAFLNGPQEVNAAFAAKLAGALTPAANDVKLQIEFNPRRVTSYRLMGYNNLRMTKEQFRDNTVSAGELAAADQGTALYNLVLNASGVGPLGTARARYRDPGTTIYHEVSWTIPYNGLPVAFDQAPPALRLAAVAGYFAEYLQQSPYASGVTPHELLNLLRGVPEAFAPDARPAGLAETLNAAASLAGN